MRTFTKWFKNKQIRCVIKHDSKAKTAFVDIYIKGKSAAATTIMHLKSISKFLKNFDESTAIELIDDDLPII